MKGFAEFDNIQTGDCSPAAHVLQVRCVYQFRHSARGGCYVFESSKWAWSMNPDLTGGAGIDAARYGSAGGEWSRRTISTSEKTIRPSSIIPSMTSAACFSLASDSTTAIITGRSRIT